MLSPLSSGRFQGGVAERGVLTFVCQCIVSLRPQGQQPYFHTNATSCTSVLRDDQIARNNRLPVQRQRLLSARQRIVIPVATRMLLPLISLFKLYLPDIYLPPQPSWRDAKPLQAAGSRMFRVACWQIEVSANLTFSVTKSST